jgi:hypothetical protein
LKSTRNNSIILKAIQKKLKEKEENFFLPKNLLHRNEN